MKSSITLSLVPEATGGPFVFWHDVANAIKTASELGFDALEIFPPDADTLQSTLDQVKASSLAVAAVGTGAGWVKHKLLLSSEDSQCRKLAIEFVKSLMQIASEFGAPVILGSMQGRSTASLSKADATKYFRESLELLDREAESLGGAVLYEPLNRYETDLANTLSEGVAVIHELQNTKLLADLFHMNIEERNLAESILAASHHVGHVHFADTNRQAVGYGHLDWQPVYEALLRVGYQGYLSAEILPKPDSLSAARQTIETYQRHLRN